MKAFYLISILAVSLFIKAADIPFPIVSSKRAVSTPWTYYATGFPTDSDYVKRTGAYTGVADGTNLTFNLWFKVNAGEATVRSIFRCANDRWAIYLFTDNTIRFFTMTSGATDVISYTSAATFLPGSTWHHIIVSTSSRDTAKRHVYIDGSSDAGTWNSYNNAVADYDGSGDSGFGNVEVGGSASRCSVSEFIWDTVNYVDVSDSAVRLRVRTAGGKPENPGSDGSLFTGSTPLIYLHGPAASINVNSGSGGNLTIIGTPVDDPAIP